jgi:hypothetical protein
VTGDPGVVHQRIEAAKRILERLEHLPHSAIIADVTSMYQCRRPFALRSLARFMRFTVASAEVDDDIKACACQRYRRRTADSGGRTGYERHGFVLSHLVYYLSPGAARDEEDAAPCSTTLARG